MTEENTEKEPLENLAERIISHANKADDHILEAAVLAQTARLRIEGGEAGNVTWSDWAKKNIGLSPSRLRELERIAKAEDPRKELERIREQTRDRVQRHREKRKSAPLRNGDAASRADTAPHEQRQRLASWAMNASEDDLEAVLVFIAKLPSNTEGSSADVSIAA